MHGDVHVIVVVVVVVSAKTTCNVCLDLLCPPPGPSTRAKNGTRVPKMARVPKVCTRAKMEFSHARAKIQRTQLSRFTQMQLRILMSCERVFLLWE